MRDALEQCAAAFFNAAWPGVAARIVADMRMKTDLRDRQGLGAALAAVSGAVALAPEGDRIVVDKLQDNATSANGAGVDFIPSVFGSPHLLAIHAPGWPPVVQYPVAGPSAPEPLSLDTVECQARRPRAPGQAPARAHPRPQPAHHQQLAHAWDLTPPEVSRRLAVLRRAGLLTTERRGRYVHYAVDLPALTALGTDLLAVVLR